MRLTRARPNGRGTWLAAGIALLAALAATPVAAVELEVLPIGRRQVFGTDDRREITHLERARVGRIQLVRHARMIVAGEVLADAVLH